jgi:hypothetical protein
MKLKIFLLSIIILFITLKSAIAMNNIYIDSEWSAGNTYEILVETEIDYSDSQITIIDSDNYTIYDGVMEKPILSSYKYVHSVPSNQQDTVFNINVKLNKQYYPTFEKSFEISVRKLTIVEKVWLFIKTNIPFIK